MFFSFYVLLFSLFLYLLSYIYSLNFINKNSFILDNFPKENSKNFSFFEIFEVQTILFAIYAQYLIFYKKNGKIPFYDEKHNVVMNNFSKNQLIAFIVENAKFLKNYFLITILYGVLFVGAFFCFFALNI